MRPFGDCYHQKPIGQCADCDAKASGIHVDIDLRALERGVLERDVWAGRVRFSRFASWEAFYQILLRQGHLLDRWDFIDLGLWKIADFMALMVEPGEELVEVCL